MYLYTLIIELKQIQYLWCPPIASRIYNIISLHLHIQTLTLLHALTMSCGGMIVLK